MVARNRKTNSRLRLYSEFQESSSGHLEKTNEADLSLGPDAVVLTVSEETTNFIRGHRSKAVRRYSIDAKRLIQLIRANGEPL